MRVVNWVALILIPLVRLQIVKVELVKLSNSFNVIVTLGSFKQKYFEISVSNNFTFCTSIGYEPKSSPTAQIFNERNLTILDEEYKFYLVKDTFGLTEKLTIKDFPFYYRPGFVDAYDELSLAYKQIDEENSFLNVLIQRGYIKKKIFAFEVKENVYESSAYFGGVPEEIIKDLKYTYCDINPNYVAWGCQLDSIAIGNYSYPINQYATFYTNERAIVVPPEYFQFLEEVFFKEYLNKNICYRIRFTFECREEILHEIYNFTFNFGGNKVFIEGHNLFYRDDQRFLFTMRKPYDSETFEGWRFGMVFFDTFNSVFDYGRKKIFFFNGLQENSGLIDFNSEQRDEKKVVYLYMANIILSVSMIILALLVKLKRNKN